MTASSPELTAWVRLGPARPAHPVIVAVPHAGRVYPAPLLARARVPLAVLEGLEDRHADLLAADAAARGCTLFVARHARAWIDLNRGERELDRTMLAPPPAPALVEDTAKVRGGLGLVPRRGAGGVALWQGPFDADDVAARIAGDHRPWHDALAQALDAARATFGMACLLDLHSMPPLGPGAGVAARIVIGDRHGRSAGAAMRRALAQVVQAAGLPVAINRPYAGGHTLDRHGRPRRGIHAVQVEIDRTLYLADDMRTPDDGVAQVARLVVGMVDALATVALSGGHAVAAE